MPSSVAKCLRILLAILTLGGNAHATFHLWRITQLYSNADGTVQFIELVALAGGQQFLSGHTLTSSQGSNTHTYTFTQDLPGDTATTTGGGYYGETSTSYKSLLIGTQGFAALGVVSPDYVVQNGFLFTTNGRVDWAGSDVFSYAALPTGGGLALNRDGSTGMNAPKNFGGQTGTVVASATALNVQDLWWKSPANSESGWGVNLTHQGDILFATWFTYDLDGSGLWLVMSDGEKTAPGTYSGTLYRTTGPAFSANPWNGAQVVSTPVGSATFTFSDANNGTFAYTVNGVTQTKPITRYVFSAPVPVCAAGLSTGTAPNYQDLWWRSPANSESGWGVNITHQGNILFATWFTYDASGKGLWLVMSDGEKTAPGSYSGTLYRTTGPAFSANPWNGAQVVSTPVGSATFTFSDANNGTFAYTVNGISQTKPITRYVYSAPTTVCR